MAGRVGGQGPRRRRGSGINRCGRPGGWLQRSVAEPPVASPPALAKAFAVCLATPALLIEPRVVRPPRPRRGAYLQPPGHFGSVGPGVPPVAQPPQPRCVLDEDVRRGEPRPPAWLRAAAMEDSSPRFIADERGRRDAQPGLRRAAAGRPGHRIRLRPAPPRLPFKPFADAGTLPLSPLGSARSPRES